MRSPRLEVTPGAALLFPMWYYLDKTGSFSAAAAAMAFHEAGHWLMLRMTGAEIRSLRLDIFGLCMDIVSGGNRGHELLCLAAGPAVGLLWVVMVGHLGGSWGERSALIGLGLNLYNLLPALPLDGGQILLALTGKKRMVRICSVCTALFLGYLSVRIRSVCPLLPAAFLFISGLTA